MEDASLSVPLTTKRQRQFRSAASFHSRSALPADFPHLLELIPAASGVSELGRHAAVAAWRKLARSIAFQSAVVEDSSREGADRLVGFGASVFVRSEFAQGAISECRPGLHHRILASIGSPNSAILDLPALKSANTRGELDLVILCGVASRRLSSELAGQVLPRLSRSFIDCHSGFNLQRILLEVKGAIFRDQVLGTGPWKVFEFPALAKEEAVHGLALMDKATAIAAPGALYSLLFNYQHPRLGLTSAEQEHTRRALTGKPDREIARELGVSQQTLKSQWVRLYEKCQHLIPALRARDVGATKARTVRGTQKRHLLIEYLRAHPEELRPYQWATTPKRKAATPF